MTRTRRTFAPLRLVERKRIGGGIRRTVLLALARHADDDGGSIYPSIAGLAAEIEFTRNAITAAVNQLVAAGLLIKVGPRRVGTRAVVTEYRIDLDAVSKLPDLGEPRKDVASVPGKDVASDGDSPCLNSSTVNIESERSPCLNSSTVNAATVLESKRDAAWIRDSRCLNSSTRLSVKNALKKSVWHTPAIPIPPEWLPTPAGIAAAEARGIRDEALQEQVRRFIDHNVAKGATWADWSVPWESWGAHIKLNGADHTAADPPSLSAEELAQREAKAAARFAADDAFRRADFAANCAARAAPDSEAAAAAHAAVARVRAAYADCNNATDVTAAEAAAARAQAAADEAEAAGDRAQAEAAAIADPDPDTIPF